MIIRKMTFADIEVVHEIEKECFAKPWTIDGLTDALMDDTANFFVAEQDGEILGYGGMHVVLGDGFVTNIAVFSKFRGRGVGKKITKKLIDSCENFITLEVRVSNKTAQNLYHGLGFKNIGLRRGFYEHPPEDAYIYTLIKGEN